MSKKIISFASAPADYKPFKGWDNRVREFKDGDVRGFELDQVIFSTAFNRNKYFIQVTELLSYKDKLSKLLANLNHDLNLTGKEYVPHQQAGYVSLDYQFNNQDFEIFGTFRTINEYFIENRAKINGPSVELMVDERTAIMNENGEYYPTFEWFATAQLLSVLAGIGDARNLSEVREFNTDLTPRDNTITFNSNNIMQEDQVKALLEEQKEELTKQFNEQLEATKKEFAVVAQSGSQSTGVYEYMDEDGKKYRTTYEEMYRSITEMVESGTVSDDNSLVQMMKAKGFAITKFEAEGGEDTPTAEGEGQPNPFLDEADKQVNNAMTAFAAAKGSESQLDQDDAKSDVTEAEARMSLYNKMRKTS